MKKARKSLTFLALTVMLIIAICAQAMSCVAATSAEFATLNAPGTVRNSPDTGAVNGYVGLRFTVGSKDITVTSLGRLFITGNSNTHEVILEDSAFTRIAAVTVPATGTNGTFTYADIATPVTLKSGETYYLGSHETYPGDGWYHNDSVVIFTDVAECNGCAYKLDGGLTPEWGIEGAAGTAYGPVSFKYLEEEKEEKKEDEEKKEEQKEEKFVETEFMKVTSFGTPRNNFGDYVGMQFTVGKEDVVVTHLGRMFIDGNAASHELMIVDAATGNAVDGSNVTVNGGKNNEFTYAPLAQNITLKAGKTYYFVSKEDMDGDFWYHNDGAISYADIGKVDCAIFRYEGVWNQEGNADTAFVPVSFKYLAKETAGGETKKDDNPGTGNTLYIYIALAAVALAAGALALRKTASGKN